MYYDQNQRDDLDYLRQEFAAEDAREKYLRFCEDSGWDPDDPNSEEEYKHID